MACGGRQVWASVLAGASSLSVLNFLSLISRRSLGELKKRLEIICVSFEHNTCHIGVLENVSKQAPWLEPHIMKSQGKELWDPKRDYDKGFRTNVTKRETQNFFRFFIWKSRLERTIVIRLPKSQNMLDSMGTVHTCF